MLTKGSEIPRNCVKWGGGDSVPWNVVRVFVQLQGLCKQLDTVLGTQGSTALKNTKSVTSRKLCSYEGEGRKEVSENPLRTVRLVLDHVNYPTTL